MGRRHNASTHLNILGDNTAEVATYLFLAAVFTPLSGKNHETKSKIFREIRNKTRAKSSYDTCDEVGRAKSSYGMSSSKIIRINRLI